MEGKKLSEMTEKEILRQQLELLAEKAKESCISAEEHACYVNCMCEIYSYIKE